MKLDQVAWYCSNSAVESYVKQAFGVDNDSWIHDTVTAKSSVWGRPPELNVAKLSFNYQLGMELELIHYINGDHWHRKTLLREPFISHLGIHLEDDEDFPPMVGCVLAQETFTISHTSEYLTTGPGAGRKYHYRIYQLGAGGFIKFIKRIHPPILSQTKWATDVTGSNIDSSR